MDSSAVPDLSTSAHQGYLPARRFRPACWQSGSASSSCWLQWEPNSHLLGLHKPEDLPKLKGDEVSGLLAGQGRDRLPYSTDLHLHPATTPFSPGNDSLTATPCLLQVLSNCLTRSYSPLAFLTQWSTDQVNQAASTLVVTVPNSMWGYILPKAFLSFNCR